VRRVPLLIAACLLAVVGCSGATTEDAQPTVSRDDATSGDLDSDGVASCEDLLAARTKLGDTDIEVFIEPALGDEPLARVLDEIESMEDVVGVHRVTQADAFVEFKEMFAETPNVTYGVSPGDLPASVQIDVEDTSAIPDVVARVEGLPGVFRVLHLPVDSDDCD